MPGEPLEARGALRGKPRLRAARSSMSSLRNNSSQTTHLAKSFERGVPVRLGALAGTALLLPEVIGGSRHMFTDERLAVYDDFSLLKIARIHRKKRPAPPSTSTPLPTEDPEEPSSSRPRSRT